MPFYSKTLLIPANTPATAPVTVDVEMTPGVVTQVGLQFPAGCSGLVHARILRGGSVVWPGNSNADMAANDHVLSWPDEYDLSDLPTALTLQGWSLDDTYPHTLTLYVALRELAKVEQAQIQQSVFERLRRYIG